MISSPEEKSLPQKISEDIISFILEEKLQPGDYVEAIPFDQKTWFVKRSAKE